MSLYLKKTSIRKQFLRSTRLALTQPKFNDNLKDDELNSIGHDDGCFKKTALKADFFVTEQLLITPREVQHKKHMLFKHKKRPLHSGLSYSSSAKNYLASALAFSASAAAAFSAATRAMSLAPLALTSRSTNSMIAISAASP